jgi:hypothetical protein
MLNRIEKLRGEIGGLMQAYLAKPDFQSVTRLAPHLARLESLVKRMIELDCEVSAIEDTIKMWNEENTAPKFEIPQPARANGESEDLRRAGPQTLRIDVDWKTNGKRYEKEIILAAKAGDVLVKFLRRVTDEFGQEALEKLSRIKINRGPLLSKTPDRDFVNQAQGKVYAHKRLPGTDYFVLTHSSTQQKKDDIDRICRVIGLVAGSVKVEAVSRADCYSEIYA